MKFLHKLLIGTFFIFTIYIFGQDKYKEPKITCSTYKIVPLRTFTDIPEDQNYYLKDTNNELPAYEGTWKGSWGDKTVYAYIKKITNKYNNHLKYNKDFLIIKFKTVDNAGNILFDNSSLSDDDARIKGGKFRIQDDKYSMLYYDKSLCNMNAYVYINFTDSTKTKLEWKFLQNMYTIYPSCFFYDYPSSQVPKPLPIDMILSKQ